MGRAPGDAEAVRAVKGRAVSDSIAWQSTSNPLAATTPAGNVAVTSASITARVGRRRFEAMPVLAPSATTSHTAMPVSSLPVPEVVGHATCGGSAPGTASPWPTGRFT